jgi:hypothetical protein
MKVRASLLCAALATGGLALAPTAANAVQATHTTIANVAPYANTPDVQDGHVEEITQVGNKIILGGNFTKVSDHGSTTVLTRNRILAFDATTGVVDTGFNPDLSDQVNALLPGPTANTVYVGGQFKTMASTTVPVQVPRLVLLDINTGARVASFATAALNGQVNDVKRSGNRLFVAGSFTTVAGVAHNGIATLNATTGALDPFMNLQMAGHHNWTTSSPASAAKAAVGPFKLDVNPAGTRLVAIGNFKTVSGPGVTNGDYDQIVMADISGTTATIANWQTNRYDEPCFSNAYDQWIRDVDFSPDGSYFVIVGTGGYPLTYSNLCDAAARWETAATGTALNPTWVDWTGGDTLLSVAVTGAAVYVGGHQRWLNNKLASDHPGPGSVPRPGLGALNPVNGLPLPWNPGRQPRGAGAYAMFASPTGVYVGSDTGYIGNFRYHHEKIAYFPLVGGTAVAPDQTGALPSTIGQAGRLPGVLYRVNAGGPALAANDGGPAWAADQTDPSALRNTGSTVSTYAPSAARGGKLPGSAPTAVFDSERYDPAGGLEMAWHFPVPVGTPLKVRLYFANRFSGTSTIGKRVFNVQLDGATVLPNYDIVKAAGNNVGTMEEFTVPTEADGSVDLGFTHVTENPLIDGIEILSTTGADDFTSRSFDGITAGAPAVNSTTGIAWSHTRGAFMVDGTLFYGWDDGTMRKRTFDPATATFGAETVLDPYDDPAWVNVQTDSGQTYRGLTSGLSAELPNVTGMFYSKGRLYYSLLGQSGLFSRYFQPDSGIVGAEEFGGDPGGINWSDAGGTFLDATNNKLYWASRADGSLKRVDWTPTPAVPTPGQPVGGRPTGAPVTVSAPGTDWRGRGVFLYTP